MNERGPKITPHDLLVSLQTSVVKGSIAELTEARRYTQGGHTRTSVRCRQIALFYEKERAISAPPARAGV
jgi:hypothetical protein